jgi:hypothetical protein
MRKSFFEKQNYSGNKAYPIAIEPLEKMTGNLRLRMCNRGGNIVLTGY